MLWSTSKHTLNPGHNVKVNMSFWRKEDPILDQSSGKVIKGGMFQHQRDWWDAPNFVKVLVTGYGGGKTFTGGKRGISLTLHNAPAPTMMVSPSYKVAKRTTIPAVLALLRGRKISFSYNKSDHEIKIYYHNLEGTMWFGSGDDPDALKGPNLGAAIIDEPFIQDRAVFEQIVARVRDPRAKRHEIGMTGTPEQLNWGYDICEGPESEKLDIFVRQASTRENKTLGPEYYERMKSAYTDKALEAFGEGKFVSLSEGLVYYAFTIDKNIKTLEKDRDVQLRVGMDFNVNPMSAIVFWTTHNHMHVVDEIQITDANTQAMCDEIRLRYGDQVRYVYPDASGGSRKTSAPIGHTDHKILERNGFYVECHHENPPVRDRENAVNGAFYHGRLTIDPKCQKLKSSLLQFNHDNRNKEQGKKLSHLLDALGYPVEYLFPVAFGSSRQRLGGY